MRLKLGIVVLAAGLLGACATLPEEPGGTLRIIPVDVEGGSATLYVTPDGRSLLVDTGWPDGRGGARPAPGAAPAPAPLSSAERIAAAARSAGLDRIDYLMVTHYHVDHLGGVDSLLKIMPVGTIIDHGPNREQMPANPTESDLRNNPSLLHPGYAAAISGLPRIVMKAGDELNIGDLQITAVNSDREVLREPLAGGGQNGVACETATTVSDNGEEENPRSLGILATWGNARVLSLADTGGEVELQLVCPRDMIGPVDVLFANDHGSRRASNPPFIQTVKPRIVIISNGATKGADAETFNTLGSTASIEDIWQLHFATRSPDKNAPEDNIANLAATPDGMHPLQIEIERSGDIKITNPRTGYSKDYAWTSR